eukprot:9371724-Pyramimonas_sp.AAC.1
MMVRVPERHTPVRPGQEIGRQVQRNVRVAIDGDPSLQAPITGQVPIPFLTAGRCSPRYVYQVAMPHTEQPKGVVPSKTRG